MKHNSQGFILIEAIFYTAIIALISVYTVQFIARTVCDMRKSITLCQSKDALYVGHYLLQCDLQQAPSNKKQWQLCNDDELLWTTSRGDRVGWLYENTILYRLQEAKTGKKKMIKNRVLNNIKEVRFTAHWDDAKEQLINIEYVLTVSGNAISDLVIQHTVFLRNRMIK